MSNLVNWFHGWPLWLLFVIAVPRSVNAQTRPGSAQEFIQSTSPLAGGGSVTSRSTPGQRVQTITTIAQLPTVGQTSGPVVGYEPRNSMATSGRYYGSFMSASPTGLNPNSTYPYPGQNPGYMTSGLNTNANYTALRQSTTLGLPPVGNPPALVAQNCPTCTGVQNYAPTAYQTPNPNFSSTPQLSGQVPSLTAPAPTYQPQNLQPGYQFQSTVGAPQFGTQSASRLTPFVTGSGVYTPLVNFRNMPAGTYLGQGIIGQPTAYVDGQPVRNLLRYISP